MSQPWIFYGVDRSHFSAKLRPALRYKQLHHVELTPDMEQIVRRTGVGFVPVLITPQDETLQDTTEIIDELEQRCPEPPLLPTAATDRVVCRLFELYADEFFPMVSMRTRWAYPDNEAELRRAFSAFSGSLERGNAVADMMSAYLPMLGVTPETIPAIDAHTDDLLAALCGHFARHSFLLGERMSLADCALMGPLYAHLYLDRVTRRKLYDEAIEVCMWIERCNRPDPRIMGEWAGGAYSDSLATILDLIGRDAAPMLLALEQAFDEWAAGHAQPGMELPRGAGTYRSSLRGAAVTAGVRAYVPWKMQRLRDCFDALDTPGRENVRAALMPSGCATLLSRRHPGIRLEKRDFKLVVAR
ncbi:MAG: glutathione S-transferase family protein [Pseudomonadales bacterium]